MLRIGDTNIMMSDAWSGHCEKGPDRIAGTGLWLYVEDCDAMFNRAVESGCKVIHPIMDAFRGDRNGRVKDPFGHCRSIASKKWDLTPDEMIAAREAGWVMVEGPGFKEEKLNKWLEKARFFTESLTPK